ncbi:uncharacterized protein LOC135225065 [Macrobrachium nipponense]|uniref:uncharacterized protein LOC135225065 n=1 Tax=Macrobrachium nipponense TaxID=159736 RepID=UPI0030C7DCDA
MEHDLNRKGVKNDPPVGHDSLGEGKEGGLSSVEKLRGYYDEARNRLKNYLAAMGSGSSSPRNQHEDGGGGGGGGGGGDGVGGVMFQQRPPHIRLEGKQVVNGEEFTDISYSDLGFIITPQSKKLTLNNNNCQREADVNHANCKQCSPVHSRSAKDKPQDPYLDNDCDSVSSSVMETEGSGFHTHHRAARPTPLSSSTPNINFSNSNRAANNERLNRHSLGSLQQRGSDGSFTLSQMRASAKIRRGEAPDRNLDDLRLEEVSS